MFLFSSSSSDPAPSGCTKASCPEIKADKPSVPTPPITPHGETKEIKTITPPPQPLIRLPPSMGSLRGHLAKRSFPMTLGFTTMLPTTSTGLVNSIISVSGVTFSSEFTSCAALFDEFFVESMTLRYQPLNQFLTEPSMSFSNPATGMLLVADLHHGQTSYSTTTSMSNAITLRVLHSARPWKHTWINVEKPTTVAASSSTSAPLPVQGWCLTSASAAALYTGFTQIRNNTLFSDVTSTSVGDILVTYAVLFRCRV